MLTRAYRLNLDMEKHKELIEFLNSIPRTLRGEFIKESIEFYREHWKDEHLQKSKDGNKIVANIQDLLGEPKN